VESAGVEQSAGGRLAPVTPLRRSASASKRVSTTEPGEARPIVALPGAAGAEPGTPDPIARSWNNTWGAEAPEPAAVVDSAPDAVDEEAGRLTRKTTALTIRQLARRGMSRWELEQLLAKREIEPEVFAPELDRLETLGVIDDAALAAALAFTQHSRKGLSRSVIEHDLKRRHIAPELIEEALADIADEDELARATELALKRIGQLSSYDDETARRRLHGFLARKGYGSSVVRQAMEAAFATRGRRGVRFQ
jgi:SOS response regulatory protein OraA/RecX